MSARRATVAPTTFAVITIAMKSKSNPPEFSPCPSREDEQRKDQADAEIEVHASLATTVCGANATQIPRDYE